MRFPDAYIKRGRFALHSGGTSSWLYDCNALVTDYVYFLRIIKLLDRHIGGLIPVGIATCGAIMASQFENFCVIHDGELKGRIKTDYVLIDDVVTTERSLRDAIRVIGSPPVKIVVLIDRREKKRLDIISLYEK